MARVVNRYSRFVAWVKIILPLGALALMSSLVLFSRSINPDGAAPYAEVDVHELARDQAVSAPTYSGVTSDGAAIVLSAATARPDLTDPGKGDATDIAVTIDTPDGERAHVSANSAHIDSRAGVARLNGDVQIETSSGYRLATDELTTALDRTDVATKGPVAGSGPLGTINAGKMHLSADENRDGIYVLVFQDGVKLVYQPHK